MAPIQKLGNPTLTLYAFHLRTSISQGPKQTTPEASQLWEQLAAIGKTLGIQELQALQQKLICYQNGHYQPAAEDKLWRDRPLLLLPPGEDSIDFLCRSLPGEPELSGFLIPYRLHDTYAIDLTLSYQDIIELTKLSELHPQNLLLPQHIRASLGQTLLLYGEAIETQNDYQPLADACVAQLFQNIALPELVATGRLLGNPIFEYDNGELDPASRCHIFVWLKSHSMAPEQIDEMSEQLVYLLWSRHKILSVYHQSRCCYRRAKEIYSILEQYTNNFKQIYKTSQTPPNQTSPNQTSSRLEKLKEWLLELPEISFEYARYLRDLKDHQTTIELNSENYKSRIKDLQSLPGQDLNFLENFCFRVDSKSSQQIQADRSYLEPGLDLSERLINSIRSVVAIEQVESDRKFMTNLLTQQQQWETQLRQQDEKNQKNEKKLEIWIAAVGIGLAVSGVSSQVNPQILESIPFNSPLTKDNYIGYLNQFLLISGNIISHVVLGLIVAIVIRKVISCFLK